MGKAKNATATATKAENATKTNNEGGQKMAQDAKRKKVSEERQALVERVQQAGIEDKVNWEWPDEAIEAIVNQAEAAKAAKSRGGGRRERDNKESFRKLAKDGKITRAIAEIMADPAKIPAKGSPQPQTRAAARKVLAILYQGDFLDKRMVEAIENSFKE